MWLWLWHFYVDRICNCCCETCIRVQHRLTRITAQREQNHDDDDDDWAVGILALVTWRITFRSNFTNDSEENIVSIFRDEGMLSKQRGRRSSPLALDCLMLPLKAVRSPETLTPSDHTVSHCWLRDLQVFAVRTPRPKQWYGTYVHQLVTKSVSTVISINHREHLGRDYKVSLEEFNLILCSRPFLVLLQFFRFT
jgi:hypothetical protein